MKSICRILSLLHDAQQHLLNDKIQKTSGISKIRNVSEFIDEYYAGLYECNDDTKLGIP